MIKTGSLWWSGDGKKFRVLSVTEVDDKTWVHYRDEVKSSFEETREYSCYIESFLERFSQLPE